MEITPKYTRFRKEITLREVASSDIYEKVYSLYGRVKMEEIFFDNELVGIEYYLDEGETEEESQAILGTYNVAYGIIQKNRYDNYTIMLRSGFADNLLKGKSQTLKDSNGRVVCVQVINLETDAPDYSDTVKYLGECQYKVDQDEGYCRFSYNQDGSFDFCEYNYFHDYDSEVFDLETLPIVRDMFGLSDGMYNYLLTADFLPPIGI